MESGESSTGAETHWALGPDGAREPPGLLFCASFILGSAPLAQQRLAC